jgi:signal transduction histidine kinase
MIRKRGVGMTVKRRLYISNILMIVIPALLSAIVGGVVINMAFNYFDIQGGRNNSAYIEFNKAITHVGRLSEDDINFNIDAFAGQLSKQDISLAIFQNGEPFYFSGAFLDEDLIEMALGRRYNDIFIIDETIISKSYSGDYTVLIIGTHFDMLYAMRDPSQALSFGIAAFAIVIVIILITNNMLTRVVYKSIATPLDTLVDGVHELRDGNLNYRIEYAGKDEFTGVCLDFNDMAGQLQYMVNARKKDDENRRELIAGISHDLRTPLTSIISYSEALEKGITASPEAQRRYITTIKRKAVDLEHIVSQLFLFSKLDVGEFPLKLEALDIGKEISGFAMSVSDEYKDKGLQVETGAMPSGVIVNADVVQLRNAITNILDNSLKYGRQENGMVNIDCRSDGQNVLIALTDNGPGVPDDSLENLFSAFYRSDKARSNPNQGSGLGLAITAKILERLGGGVAAENIAGGGLNIVMKLPIIDGGTGDEKNIDS